MNEKSSIFYAKLLLFGEYSVITGSKALSIPYSHFNGELSFIHQDKYTDYDYARWSNRKLVDLLGYLKDLSSRNKLNAELELDRFEKDINSGLYFESTIPQGYGIGSSGALVASVYHHYANPAIRFYAGMDQQKITVLKKQFARMESFYHGTSSGIDPLNSYARVPLLIKNMQHIEAVSIPRNKHFSEGAIFLIDTGRPGNTEPLVNKFLENLESSEAASVQAEEINQVTNAAIDSLINEETNVFFDKLKALSIYQLKHLHHMIPEDQKSLWKHGLESDNFYLKLCGSGGGGFLLGFTHDYPKLQEIFNKLNIQYIPVYMNK